MIAYIGEIVNLLNTDSYYGIQYNYFNGGAAPTINGVYGSPVKLGVEIDAIADIGRIENLHFSPEYWIGSNLNATALTQANKNCIRDYIYDNGVGLSMRRNDWSFSCYLDIEGYNIGFRAAQTLSTGDSAVPNGHNYGFKFTGCKTGIQLDRSDHVGIMFSDIVIDDCEKGIVIPNTNSGFIQFSNADIKAKRNAIEQHSGTLMLNSSIIREGYVLINGGTFNALGNIFQNKTPQITYGYTSRGILTDNEFTNTYTISDSSINKHTVVNTPGNDYAYAKIKPPVFPNETAAPLPKGPARNAVYVVDTTTNIPVLFPGNDNSLSYTTTTSTPDATSRIQAKLDEAATAGGGIVFLPPGKYRVAGSLTIPSGVELRGAGGEIATVPHGVGSILEIYGGKNNPGGDPAIIMESGSGMRGVVINYPEQLISNISAGKLTTFAYPYTIQGRGDNIYVINVGLRAVLNGMDFDTYRCDNLYVDFVTGHVFDQALKYGNNAEGAIIKNVMANVIVYGCGDESKYGTWANGDRSKVSGGGNQHTYTYSYENLDFMEIGDCKNTYMFNNFHYGSKIGIHYINQGNGGPQNINNMGLGIDGARQSVMFDSGLTGTYNFINSQTVSTNGGTYNDATYMIGKANSSFTANIYGSDYWGQPYTAFNLEANSGIINLYCANVAEAGSAFINLAGGQLNFLNSNMRGNTTDRRSSNGSAPYIKQISSLMNYTNSGTKIGPTSYGPEEGGAKYTFQDKTAWTGVRTWASQTFSGNKDDVLIENDDAWSGGWQDTTVRSGQLTSTFPLVLQIDMGAAKTFDVIQIEWGGGGGSDYPRANFQIWQSNTAAPTGWGTTANTTNFAQIASITSAAAGTSTYEIASITARYLMLRISANPNQGAHWAVKNVRIGTKNPSPILSRTGWTAQAKGSADSTNAGMAINGVLGNSNNEWKMGWQNASGTALPQWWMVDTGSAAKNYNTVLLVHGGGGNDWPEGGQICTGTAAACWSTTTTAGVTGTNWTVRGPNNIGSSTKIDIGAQTARYVMIRRPVGSADRGAYWAIQDFQLANFVDIAQPTANQNALRQASYLGYRIVIEPDSSWTRASGTGNTINFRVIIDPDFTGTPVVSYRAAGGATVGTTITPTAGVYSTNNLTADRIIEVTGITKKTEQTIAFPDNNAPRNILTNDTSGPYPVTTTGAGSGAITYSSANPLIATVNATTGEVTPLNIGTTTITARKAEDATYASATASYVLTVSSPESAAAQTPPIVYARGFEPGIEVRDAASTTVTGRVQKDPVEGKFAYFIQDHACPSSEGYEIDVRAAWGVDVSEANYLAFDIMATNTAILADINGFYPRICNGDSTWGKFTQYNGGSALSNINTLGANTWKTISIPIDASANIASTEQGGVDKTDVTAVRLRLTRSVKTKLPVTGNGTLFIRNVRFQAAPSTPAPNYTPTVPMGPTDSTFNSRGAGVAATAPDRYPSYKMNLNSSNTIVHINYTNENNLQDLSEYTNKFFVFEMYVTDASLLDLNPNGNNWFIMVGEKDKWNNSRARLNLNVAEIRKAKPKTWVTVSAQLTKNNTGGKTFSEGDEGGVPYTDAMFGFDEIRRMGLQLDWNGPTTGDIYIREPRFQDNPFSPGSEAPTASNPIITSNYTADPSAHVWLDHDGGERLWLYPSTDIFPARGCNMMDQYHVYSTDNMLDWIDHGEIIRRDDIPTTFGAHHSDAYFMWAPDAAYNANATGTKKGPFFYYFPHSTGMDGGGATGWGENWYIFVANSDSPYENFKTNGFTNSSTAFVRLTDSAGNLVKSGTNMDIIDPCVFADDDGTYYMITGGGGQCRIARLKPSMTQLDEPWTILNQRYNSGLTASYNKLPNYHEGPWLFYRYNDSGVKIYYLAYPGNPTGAPGGDDMLYCTASSPYGPWTPRGSILGQVNTGDTSHGSIQQFKGKWYIFYHNAVLSGGDGALRSVCVEEIVFNPDGTIQFAPQTDTSVPAVAPPVKKSDLDKEFGKDEYKIEKKFRDIKPPDPDDFQYLAGQYPAWDNDCKINISLPNGPRKQNNTRAIHNFDTAIFTNVDGGPLGGTVMLALNYSSPNNKTLQVTVNSPLAVSNVTGKTENDYHPTNKPAPTGGPETLPAVPSYTSPYPIVLAMDCPSNDQWEQFDAYGYVIVDLLPGPNNRIMFKGDSINVKGLDVYFEGRYDDYTVLVSESQVKDATCILGGDEYPVHPCKGGDGGAYAEYTNSPNAFVRFTQVDGGAGGLHVIEIEYATDTNNANFTVNVNGVPTKVHFANTGGWGDSALGSFKMFVFLNPGTDNVIEINNGTQDGANFKQLNVWAKPDDEDEDDIPILSAAVTVTAPVPGNAPNATAVDAGATGDFTLGAVSWSPTHNPFQYEVAYKATLTLTAAEDMTFEGLTNNVTINGFAANITANDGDSLTIEYTFPATPLTPITAAAITVTAPEIGETPSGAATDAGATGDFTLGTVAWAPTAGTFAAGQAYTATVTLTAATGKTFAGFAGTPKINGFNATVAGTPGATMTITYTFPAIILAPIPIKVTAPVPGATPSNTGSDASGEGRFTVNSVSWAPVNNPFVADAKYTVTIKITAGTVGTFNGIVAGDVTVNGAVATIISNKGTTMTVTYTFADPPPEPPAPPEPVLEFNGINVLVTAPVIDAAPVNSGTPDTGNGYFSGYTVNSVAWAPVNNPFMAGAAYTVTVKITAETGKTFADIPPADVKINGNAAVIISNKGTSMTLTYTFATLLAPPPQDPPPVVIGPNIANVGIQITAPETGQLPSTAAIPGSADYIITSVGWAPVHNPFNAGAMYTVTFKLMAVAGKTFEGIVPANILVNGMTGVTVISNKGTTMTITYTFPITA